MTSTRRRSVLIACLLLLLVPLLAVVAAPPASASEPDRLDTFGGGIPDHGAPVLPGGTRIAGAATHPGGGYWLATDAGGVYSHGGAPFHGSAGNLRLAAPVVGVAARPAGDGYWLVAADGGVLTYGAAPFRGSAGGLRLASPIVGIAATPSGEGYWLVAADGGVFSFGDAPFAGSLGDRPLAAPIVGIAAARTGYWLVGADGGVFGFGGAPFHGSMAGTLLQKPVIGIAPVLTMAGDGYVLAAADGGVFTFGPARFAGSGVRSGEDVTALATHWDGSYLLARSPLVPVRPSGPPPPANSGTGRRIIYSNTLQRVWLVGADGGVERTYLVSGRRGVPAAGTYRVFSKSPVAYAGHDGITMRNMIRFTRGSRLAIGFHDIPRDARGRPLQRDDDLGGYRSAGCVRQSTADAEHLWSWAPVGTTVVVIY